MATSKIITKKKSSDFWNKLGAQSVEKGIEQAYKNLIEDAFSYHNSNALFGEGYAWDDPFACDGFFYEVSCEHPDVFYLRILNESKYNLDFTKRSEMANVLIQVIFYLKKFKTSSYKNKTYPFPNIIFVGDINECFALHASILEKYLSYDINWDIAPSEAHDIKKYPQNEQLLNDIISDNEINPLIYKKGDFLGTLFARIESLAKRQKLEKVDITPKSIRDAFDRFCKSVVEKSPNQDKLDIVDIVNIFILSMTKSKDIYPKPNSTNILVVPQQKGTSKEIKFACMEYTFFFDLFNNSYNEEQKRKFTEIADRLIEDSTRRFRGDFWTPSFWASRAYEEIQAQISPNFKDEFVVWDCCCGTKNLTRDEKYKRLYCSTYHQGELNISETYNKEAIATFQYDFLNDDINISPNNIDFIPKMPQELYNDLKAKKPFLFFINPPYGTANPDGAKNKGEHKAGMAKTAMGELAKKDGAGASAQQLYAQFLWRIFKLKKDFDLPRVVIAVFIKPGFFTPSEYFAGFKKRLFSEFVFKSGFIFPASDFADVSGKWGVSFCVFDSDGAKPYDEKALNKWSMKVLRYDANEAKITEHGEKSFYSWDKKYSLSEWIREPIKHLKNQAGIYPQLSSATTVSTAKGEPMGVLKENAFGYLVNVANNIYQSSLAVYIVSSSAYMGHGVSVNAENFERVIVNFVVRVVCANKLSDFLHDKDEFHVPDESKDGYRAFVYDCMVYSFFHNQNNSASFEIEYKGTNFDIRNEFFLYSKEKMLELANVSDNTELYNDTRVANKESYMSIWLNNHENEASKEAKELLSAGFEYIKSGIKSRQSAELSRWDASYKQLKNAVEPSKELKDLISQMKNRIFERVKYFGFMLE